MPINVIYSAGNRFSPVTVTGRRIFDLSVNARMPKGSMSHFFVTGTQDNILANLPKEAVQVLPPEQAHITVINPIFRMEPDKGSLPSEAESEELFSLFRRAMTGDAVRSLISNGIGPVLFDRVVFRERDVKLYGQSDGLKTLREGLEGILRDADSRFDFAEGMPETHTTLVRFGDGMSKGTYKQLRALIERAVIGMDEPVNFHITPETLVGVMFPGLFLPWEREFSLLPGADS